LYHLRSPLIGGQLAPGERLSLRAIAEPVGGSMMPVRETVSRFVADGALEGLPETGLARAGHDARTVSRTEAAACADRDVCRSRVEPRRLKQGTAVRCHAALVQALRRRDPEAAREAVVADISAAAQHIADLGKLAVDTVGADSKGTDNGSGDRGPARAGRRRR
jgi:DNA-binding GntR family transcriptional regulator